MTPEMPRHDGEHNAADNYRHYKGDEFSRRVHTTAALGTPEGEATCYRYRNDVVIEYDTLAPNDRRRAPSRSVWKGGTTAEADRLVAGWSNAASHARTIEALRAALNALWGLWNDKDRCRMKADLMRGHLSYANTIEELERPIASALKEHPNG